MANMTVCHSAMTDNVFTFRW